MSTALSDAQKLALDDARYLAQHGVPMFLAQPDPTAPTGFRYPKGWQNAKADPTVVDGWEPGMALCAVMGHLVDAIDVDPRNGGEGGYERLGSAGLLPSVYAEASTPSGGRHYLIATMGVRSQDGAFAGVDVKAGDADGAGRGFVFIAPTERVSKTTGEVVAYRWTQRPAGLAELEVLGDDSGSKLAEHLRRDRGAEYAGPPYDGPTYDELPEARQRLADNEVASVVASWRARFAEALTWAVGERDSRGWGWHDLSIAWPWTCARLAATPWMGVDADRAGELHDEVLPEAFAANDACRGKWYPGLVAKAAMTPVEPPWWDAFASDTEDEPDPANPSDWPELPTRLDDAHLAAWMAHKGLEGRWCWAGGLGWMHWDDRRWVPRRDEDTREAVRLAVIAINTLALQSGVDRSRMRDLTALLSTGRIGSLTSLMRGVVSVDPGRFDQHPDHLNVGNGVVYLPTGELGPHDPDLYLTRITDTLYAPGATHEDWGQALVALDPEVADWMQVRLGQAATGHPTSDDVLPIGQGGGSNGKTTILTALSGALGEHMTYVPEKLIRASPNDHPTELMTLRGARVAVIDETPEVAQLNVQRLKATIGSEHMTARQVHKDNVSWKTTHSLFVMTNYRPSVTETDFGTWRRLALVRFTKTFPKDDRFRARMARGQDGRREAVLAWVVEGARCWYANDRTIPDAPERVVRDTRAWRQDTDLVLAYVTERLVFEPQACVASDDLLADLNDWLLTRGHQAWSDKLLTSRFAEHQEITAHHVVKARPRRAEGLVPLHRGGRLVGRPTVWQGLRWRTPKDDE